MSMLVSSARFSSIAYGVPGTASYWRIRYYGIQGPTDQANGYFSNYADLAELQFETASGAGDAGSGTAIAVSTAGGTAASNAFDGNNATGWSCALGEHTPWIGKAYGASYTITHVKIRALTWFKGPRAFWIENSLDAGTTWNVVAFCVAADWVANPVQEFSISASRASFDFSDLDEVGGYRYWAIKAESPGSYASAFTAYQSDATFKKSGSHTGREFLQQRFDGTLTSAVPFSGYATLDDYFQIPNTSTALILDMGYKRLFDQVGFQPRATFNSQCLSSYKVYAGDTDMTIASMSLIKTVDDHANAAPAGGAGNFKLFAIP